MIQVVAPVRGIVTVAIDVPLVRDVILLKETLHSLADADEAILISTGKVEQLELLFCRIGVGQQFGRRFGVGRRGEPAHPREGVG